MSLFTGAVAGIQQQILLLLLLKLHHLFLPELPLALSLVEPSQLKSTLLMISNLVMFLSLVSFIIQTLNEGKYFMAFEYLQFCCGERQYFQSFFTLQLTTYTCSSLEFVLDDSRSAVYIYMSRLPKLWWRTCWRRYGLTSGSISVMLPSKCMTSRFEIYVCVFVSVCLFVCLFVQIRICGAT